MVIIGQGAVLVLVDVIKAIHGAEAFFKRCSRWPVVAARQFNSFRPLAALRLLPAAVNAHPVLIPRHPKVYLVVPAHWGEGTGRFYFWMPTVTMDQGAVPVPTVCIVMGVSSPSYGIIFRRAHA